MTFLNSMDLRCRPNDLRVREKRKESKAFL